MNTNSAFLIRHRRASFFGVLLVLVLFLQCSPRAFAHAVLVRSTPADGAVLHTGNITFTLDYNSRIDERRSVLQLTGSGSQEITLTTETPTGPARLKAAVRGLKSGVYHLAWQVLAEDGHITRGAITFTVAAQ
jgi:methionine-rich copper-binding protein CopC